MRHGRAVCADENIVGGRKGCTGLSDLGRTQAAQLRDRLRRTRELGNVDVLVASTLPRAVETAALIAPALGLDPTGIEQDCDFCELHVGEADGMSWVDWRRDHGAAFDADADRAFAPRGESLNQFADRVERAMRRLAVEHAGRTVVVACHGGVVAFSMIRLLGRTNDVWLNADNTSITEWHVTADGRWALARFNDAAHLLPP